MDCGNVKTLAEIVALFAAALFFLYKVLGGWLNVNLDISIEAQRINDKNNAKEDLLSILIKIKKGENGSITLNQILIEREGAEPEKIKIRKKPHPIEPPYIVCKWSQKNRYRISSNEATHFSTSFKVPKDEVWGLAITKFTICGKCVIIMACLTNKINLLFYGFFQPLTKHNLAGL